jgi:roadblock/LC7 domain-containing protein
MLEQLIGPISGLLGKFVEDKDQKNALAHEIATLAQKEAHKNAAFQLEVNKTEAAHKSLFVAGWRPFIGWCCGLGLLYSVLLSPLLGVWFDMPAIDSSILMQTMTGILGLGVLRSYEKVKGVSREK